MRLVMFALVVVGALSAQAQEMTGPQKEAWTALEEQIELGAKKDWDAMRKYLHPSLSIWGDNIPTPVGLNDKSYRYFTGIDEDAVEEWYLAPVSVVVVGEVAIINCYYHVFVVDDEGEKEEVIYRLHNTWKEHEGRWKLLATYNTLVESDDD